MLDRALDWHEGSARLAAVTWSPLPAGFRQVTVKAGITAFGTIDVLVDGLVTDGASVLLVQPEPTGDLLRRPAALKPADDVAPQAFIAAEFLQALAPPPSEVVRGHREVAGVLPLLVEAIAVDLAMEDRRCRPSWWAMLATGTLAFSRRKIVRRSSRSSWW